MTERPNIVPIGELPKESPAWDLAPGEVLVQVMTPGTNLMNETQIHGTVSALAGAPRPGLMHLEETRATIANG